MKIICAGGAPAALYFANATTLRGAGHTSTEIQFEHLRKGQ
jgi:hypothetical protein